MNVSEYRQQYEQQLDRAAKQSTNYRDFLNKFKSVAERIGSSSDALISFSEEDLNELANIIVDRDEDIQIRISALQAIGNDIGDSDGLIDLVIGLLTDKSEAPTLQITALGLLQTISFSSSIFRGKRPEYLAALRALVDRKNTKLRYQAIEILASEKDEYVQRRLIEGLEGRSKAIIPTAKAIQLLGYDIHAEHYPILHKIVENPPSRIAKKEAIRLLASDPSSYDLLAQVFTNKSEHESIRRRSAISLELIAPERFEELAKQTILDDREDDKLRATCVNALEHSSHQKKLIQAADLTQKIQQLKTGSSSKLLKQATASYMSKSSI
jgi:hypothetical protein